jgi:hypothetical protein
MGLISVVTVTIKYQLRRKRFEKMKTVDIQDSLLSRYGYCLPASWAVCKSTSLAPAYKHLETHSASGDAFSRLPVTANSLCLYSAVAFYADLKERDIKKKHYNVSLYAKSLK